MSPYAAAMQELLEAWGLHRWTVVDDTVLLCPCGHRVEYDGACLEGCVSPLRARGMI